MQAYALSSVVFEMGHNAEVISYITNKNKYIYNRLQNIGFSRSLNIASNKIRTRIEYIRRPDLKEMIKVRDKNFLEFENQITHSAVCNDYNIFDVIKKYDLLICGSDQIWNPGLWNDVYFLNINGYDKKKISYAASIGRSSLTQKEKDYISSRISKFDSISVREKSAYDLIQPLVSKPVSVVLDPTFLIDIEKWKIFASKPSGVPDNYVFLFSLSNNEKLKRDLFEQYDGVIPIVTIPHLQTGYKNEDEKYSHIKLYNIAPREWVWLILNAKIVYTDSFHGTAFSINLNKDFFVLNKNDSSDSQTSKARLTDLLDEFNLRNRIIIEGDVPLITDFSIDYRPINQKIVGLRNISFDFLKNNLS